MKIKALLSQILAVTFVVGSVSGEVISVPEDGGGQQTPEQAQKVADWLAEATRETQSIASEAVSIMDSAESLGGLENIQDTSVSLFSESGSNASSAIQSLGSGFGTTMPADQGLVEGALTAITSVNLASSSNQAKQTIFDTLGKFLDQIKFFEQVQRMTATANKAITMVNQGFETLRIVGDPKALMGALGMESVGDLAGNVRDVYNQGMRLYDFGSALASVAQGGNGGGLSSLMSVAGAWTDLADIRTPQEAMKYLDASRYRGYDSLKAQYSQARSTMDSFGQSDQQLLAQLQQTTNQLAHAKDQSQIMMLQSKADNISALLGKNGSDEQRVLLRLLAHDAMNRSQWDAQKLSERDQFTEELDQISKDYEKGQQKAATGTLETWASDQKERSHSDYLEEVRRIRDGNQELVEASEPDLPTF